MIFWRRRAAAGGRRPTAVTASGPAAVGVGGDVYAPITTQHTTVLSQAPVDWPICVGPVPALASAFQPRHHLRSSISAPSKPGDDPAPITGLPEVAEAPVGEDEHELSSRTQVLVGGGGVGKTQLAAWFAHQAMQQAGTDLVVWVAASRPEQILSVFAQAAARVQVPGVGGADVTTDATAFLEWLARTDRSWLIVLDDVTDPSDVTRWWPPASPSGRTLCTTRRRDAVLSGGGRIVVGIDAYEREEAGAYLRERLNATGPAALVDARTDDLAEALGYLPLALSHAAAYMIDQHEACASYLDRYIAGRQRLDEIMPDRADADSYGRSVAVTFLLALDAADHAEPAGLARPMIALAAVLDPAGHPEAFWSTRPAAVYMALLDRSPFQQRLRRWRRSRVVPVSAEQARQALLALHRFGLITHVGAVGPRAIRMHALTARAAREKTVDPSALTVLAAAEGLVALWPEIDHATTDLIDALRANTTVLRAIAGDALWDPEPHPLLYRAGISLLRAGLYNPAISWWQSMVADSERLLGDQHLDTFTARNNLATAYLQAGRIEEGLPVLERVVRDSDRVLGSQHSTTRGARGNLASAYAEAGRRGEAIAILESLVDNHGRVDDGGGRKVLAARLNLGMFYLDEGRVNEAIAILEGVVGDREKDLGEKHPDTIIALANLASSYSAAGRDQEAVAAQERAVSARAQVFGDEHPETLGGYADLVTYYDKAGRTDEAIALLTRVVDDSEQFLGAQHPTTIAMAEVLLALRDDDISA